MVEQARSPQPTPQGGQNDEDLKHKVDQLLAKVQAHLAKIQRKTPR